MVQAKDRGRVRRECNAPVILVLTLLAGGAVLADEPPRAAAELEKQGNNPLTREYWSGKPVWIASTLARLYDISPDGKRFLFSDHSKFGVFARNSGKLVWVIDDSTIHDAKFSPDGKTIAAGEWQNGVNFYDAATGKKLDTLSPGEERPWQVHYRPDGTLLYHTSASGYSAAPPWSLKYSVVHYDPVAKKQLGKISETIKYENSNVWLWHQGAGFFLERTQKYGADSSRHTARYADPIRGKWSPEIELDLNDSPFDVNPDGTALLVRTVSKSPRVVDIATGKLPSRSTGTSAS